MPKEVVIEKKDCSPELWEKLASDFAMQFPSEKISYYIFSMDCITISFERFQNAKS